MSALVAFNRANNLLNQQTRTGNTLALFAGEYDSDRLAELVADLLQAVERFAGRFCAGTCGDPRGARPCS